MKKTLILLFLLSNMTAFGGEREAERISIELLQLSNSLLPKDEISELTYVKAQVIDQLINTIHISEKQSEYDALLSVTSSKLKDWSIMSREEKLGADELKALLRSRSETIQQFIIYNESTR